MSEITLKPTRRMPQEETGGKVLYIPQPNDFVTKFMSLFVFLLTVPQSRHFRRFAILLESSQRGVSLEEEHQVETEEFRSFDTLFVLKKLFQ